MTSRDRDREVVFPVLWTRRCLVNEDNLRRTLPFNSLATTLQQGGVQSFNISMSGIVQRIAPLTSMKPCLRRTAQQYAVSRHRGQHFTLAPATLLMVEVLMASSVFPCIPQ